MKNLYETDYYQWLQQQKDYLSNRQFEKLDIENLINEIGDTGSELDTLETRLTTLLLHLLKYHYQTQVINPVLPEPYNCRDWKNTISRTRLALIKLIKRRPHLKGHENDILPESYKDAKHLAIEAMNYYVQPHQQLNNESFPDVCPWSFDTIMQEGWLPA